MHVLRFVRVLLPVLIVAAVVGAGSSVLSARPDLQKAKRNVETSWSSLSGQLDQRYLALQKVDDGLRPILGPMHALVGSVDGAIAHWHDVRGKAGVATQVAAANDVEALARRLVATEAVSPRVKGNATLLQTVAAFLADHTQAAAGDFNKLVTSYEHTRRGPVRAVVAAILGYRSIPVLDTTASTVSATTS
jgi:hypothetical protein